MEQDQDIGTVQRMPRKWPVFQTAVETGGDRHLVCPDTKGVEKTCTATPAASRQANDIFNPNPFTMRPLCPRSNGTGPADPTTARQRVRPRTGSVAEAGRRAFRPLIGGRDRSAGCNVCLFQLEFGHGFAARSACPVSDWPRLARLETNTARLDRFFALNVGLSGPFGITLTGNDAVFAGRPASAGA